MKRSCPIWKEIICLGVVLEGRTEAFAADKYPEPTWSSLEVMVEDSAPPWSCADGKGYANDIVEAAFKEMGVRVDLKVVPYARCKKTVLKGQVAACFSMSWHSEFEGLVQLATYPIIFLNADIFENIKKPLPRPIQGGCSLPAGTRLGVVRAYEYPQKTMALLTQGVKFEDYLSDTQTLKMLASGRLDAAVIMTNDLEPKNQKALEARANQQVQFAFNCGQEVGTVGFSLKHPRGPAAREIYEEGYRRLMRKGKLKSIAAKWDKIR